MKRKPIQLVLGLLICITTSYATITREVARDFVLSQIVTDRIGNVNVLLSDELIAVNTNVSGMGHTVLTPYSSNWVAFIDEAPAFGWTHACSYVFIDSESGQHQIHMDQYPLGNAYGFNSISSVNFNSNTDIIIPPSTVTNTRPTNENLYAILINATIQDPPLTPLGTNNYLRFWNELSAMYCTLTSTETVNGYGCPKSHISVLSAGADHDYGQVHVHSQLENNWDYTYAGNHYRGLDLDGGSPSEDIQYVCSLANLTSVFTSLGTQVDSDDEVIVFLTGHGSYSNAPYGSCFQTWYSEDVSSPMFDSLLDNLNGCKQVTIIATGCQSGGYINGDVPITGHNRTVITSTNFSNTHYALEREPAELWYTPVGNNLNSGYGEFAYYFISALRGRYPVRDYIDPDNGQTLINQPWNNGPLIGNYPFPGFPASTHPNDISRLSLTQSGTGGNPLLFRAYQYADIWDTVSDQDLLAEGLYPHNNYLNLHSIVVNDNPWGSNYRTHPQYHSNGCLYRDRQTLDNVYLNLSGYTIRDRLTFYDRPISFSGSLSVYGNEACLSLKDNSVFTMTPNSTINLYFGAKAKFDNSRLNMNSSNISLNNSSSLHFINNSVLNAVSGASGNCQITGNTPATYVENVVNGGTNYANHIGSETLIRGDFVEFRNSIFETYGSDTHRFRIKSNIQTQDPSNPILWDGVYFYDCEQDFIDNPFQYVNFEYLDKISFNNCEFSLDHCNINNSAQLVVENNSSVQVVGSSYSTNDGPIYVSHSAIDIQSSQIINNRLGGIYLNYPRTSQGNNWISNSTINNNGLHGIRTSNCLLNLDNTVISDNDGQGIYNFSIVSPRFLSGVLLENNSGAEIFSTYSGFPIFNPSGSSGINQIIDNGYIDETLDKYYLMALGAPQNGSIHLLNTSIDHSNNVRFYPSINCYTFYGNLSSASRILANAMNLLTEYEYYPCLDSLKLIIETYPDTKEAKSALGLLPYVDKAINADNTSLIQYLDSISGEYLDDDIIDSKILSFIYNKDYISAINNLEFIMQNPPTDYKLLAAMLDEAYCYYLSTIEGKGNVLECTVMPKNRVDYNTICADLQNQLNEFSAVEYSNQNFVNHSIEVSNYPNPFNPTTTLSFSLPSEMVCKIEIYNVRGQKVKTLLNESLQLGRHSVVWDGKDAHGRLVSSGVYFYRLDTPYRTQTSKMLLMK